MEETKNTAELFTLHKPGKPYTDKYNVVFDGELIVEGSRDPEPDLARALKARDITGTVTVLDGHTGKPRTVINIEKAAKITAVEAGNGPRFVKYRKETVLEAPSAGEDRSAA